VTWGPLRAALSSALVALDFDGTLAPISTLTVGVSSRRSGPVAEQADVTVPGPQGLMSLLRQILPEPADPAAVAKG
jgi:hypothetical protein